MKIAQNFALVTLYLLISGCGLILDIACIASGTPRTISEEDKSDARHDLEKVKREMDQRQEEQRRSMAEQQRQSAEQTRALMESLKRGDHIKKQ